MFMWMVESLCSKQMGNDNFHKFVHFFFIFVSVRYIVNVDDYIRAYFCRNEDSMKASVTVIALVCIQKG